MIDLNNLENYIENNRIEAKTALGGLPKSIWETYSAFANTLGGVILLGVREDRDKSFHTVDLPDPEGLMREFLQAVNDPKIASVNILGPEDVRVEIVNGDHILVIEVPRADRLDRPVFVDGNRLHAYRRNGEGDYRCTRDEYQAMMRDASRSSQDMPVLEDLGMEAFHRESVQEYRRIMKLSRPGHEWEMLDDEAFLLKIGASGRGGDGKDHPTRGGLLMFGTEADIVRVFPQYSLEYRDENDISGGEPAHIVSSSGDWSGNLMDFFFRVSGRLEERPELTGPADVPVCMAVRETLANCIVNADYFGKGGILVIAEKDCIRMSNPGSFRIGVGAAKKGGESDPRNPVILKMFGLIDICRRSGSGIPNILRVWKEHGWQEPEISQTFDPDRTDISLPLRPAESRKPQRKAAGKEELPMRLVKRGMIIDYLTEHIVATTNELSAFLDVTPSRVRDYLRELVRDGIVVPQGENRGRKYRLKS